MTAQDALAAGSALVAGYLIGSIPSGLLLTRRTGVDLRRSGSGNIGATNVARTVGIRAGLLTLAADIGKGLLATEGPRALSGDPLVALLGGVAAVAGHVWPVFASFRGGKGVATAFGAFLALAPAAAGLSLAAFTVVAIVTRYASAASVTGTVVLPVACALLGDDPATTVAATLVAALVIARHRDNLRRLWAGTEPRFRAARPGTG